MRTEDFPVRLCEISAISFAFADLLRGTKGLKGVPSVAFDLYCCSRENKKRRFFHCMSDRKISKNNLMRV